ncbi:hypothetical protein [Cytobacillus firmus]|uniref:hypothetical protein n=1 Tax=Cytobacillus firmus TaxID=1399 RepID=UPI0018CF88F0|nr:hypothetical protein [Cytobacillus firmus]MBG9548540.1 phage protein [Cytobacillus firmus]MBG9602962.1 phage protein [Cytobacillus firmus]MBG9654852.1 phage protein [Cytobacillus firmus]MED1906143.1 hypothetical protein [Cytobacillus firmus]MED1941558.1 hypothetical protein [Cytobacillus firmus]
MNNERELGWDDEIEKDGSDFILLPEGDYNFTVAKFERARFQGSAKMPACNQAKLELTVHSPDQGDVTIFHNLFLHTKTEGLLSNFFAGIGQKKKGEKLRMNWNTVIGSKGRLKLEINKFKGNDGVEKTNNQVKKFYPYEEAFGQQQSHTQQPGYQQPPQQPTYQQQQTPFPTNNQQGGFTPGQF